MHRTTSSILMVFALLLTTAGGTISMASSRTQSTPEAGIDWTACATDALPSRECGELAVPLDYDEPNGPTISLVVARVPATNRAARIGSLFLNPGGPGGSGIAGLPIQHATMPAALREQFDVVGFDPRGVGNSAPVRCFASIEEQVAFRWEYISEWAAPAGPADEAAALAGLEEIVRSCGERNADILPHVSTANVARDMDLLRGAVGDEQMNFFGTSYGTYLGETYANLFPDRIRAMALDGTINPSSYTSFDSGDGEIFGPDTTSFGRILSAEASTATLVELFAQCAAAGPERCAFAAPTGAETSAKFDELMARLRAEPATSTGPAGTLTVTYSLVAFLVWNGLYMPAGWPQLMEGLQLLAEGNTAGYLASVPGLLGGPAPTDYPNDLEAQWAINCVDTDNPADPTEYQALARSAEERSPYFGPLWLYQSLPCAFWPAQDEDRYAGPWDAETSAPILIISRVFDPATPHGGAIAAEQTLGNARLLTIDGWGHGYFVGNRSTCADAATAAYFIDGQLPAEGTICAEDAPPFGR